MARIDQCPKGGGRIHIHSDRPNSVVCVNSQQMARDVITHGTRMGIISQADYQLLQAEVLKRLDLPKAAVFTPAPCGCSHTFVRGIFDALDAITGLGGKPHPKDVN